MNIVYGIDTVRKIDTVYKINTVYNIDCEGLKMTYRIELKINSILYVNIHC